MRKRVDAERRAVVNEAQARGTGKEESAAGVAPAEPCNDGRDDKAHAGAEDAVDVPAVLPAYDLVLRKTEYVDDTRTAAD